MTTGPSILWRLVLTSGTLLLLASCGIEQSTPAFRPPGIVPPVMSPPLPSASLPTAFATLAPAPPSSQLPGPQVPALTPSPAALTGQPKPQLTVTLADNGKTIPLRVGQTFLLSLAPDYEWTIRVDNPAIVSRVAQTVVGRGQGVYEAKRPGTTGLQATGSIICPPGQACILIALEFRVQLTVR